MGQKEKPPARDKTRKGRGAKSNPNEGSNATTKADIPPDSPHTEHMKAALLNSSAMPKPDNNSAIDFLLRWAPAGPWALTAIHPTKTRKGRDGKTYKVIHGRLFTKAQFPEMVKWLNEHNGEFNVYFSVNTVMPGFDKKKAERADIKSMDYLHVDCDAAPVNPDLSREKIDAHLKAELTRIYELFTTKLPQGIPPPNVITFSGGGYQAFWKLKAPYIIDGDTAKYEDAKLYNVQLETLFGGDNCHNVDRIMRLPGTVNIPDAKKLKKGRKADLARLIKFADDVAYSLDQFAKAATVRAPKQRPADNDAGTVAIGRNVERLADVDALDRWEVPVRVKVIVVQGHHPEETKEDNSRSSWLFDVICNLYRKNVPDDVVYSIITDKEFGISASVLDKGSNIEKYALRQMQRAKANVTNEAADFRRDKNELIVASSQHNIRVALRKLGVKVRRDAFQDHLLISGLADTGPLLDDRSMERLWLAVDEEFGFRPAKEFFWIVVSDYARQDSFHPVRDYLDSLTWDGTPRLDDWLATYGGADATDYTRAVGVLMLIAAVRRVRQPGCKFDEMLVLESEQGTDKSSALKILAVEESWFTDDMPLNADGKGVIERLRGRWIVECAELRGMRRGEIEHVKAFLSRQVDRARLSYDRLNTEVARQSVFFGTTNSSKYLRDVTGARRFWPVRVKAFDLVALRRDRDRLWAEAAQREAAGESIRLDPALYAAAAVEQNDRSVEDPFLEQIAHVLHGLSGKILNVDAWEIIGVPISMRTQEHNARFGEAMKTLGWERTKGRIDGRVANVYAKGDKQQREVRIRIERDSNDRVNAWAELDVDQRQAADRQPQDGKPPF